MSRTNWEVKRAFRGRNDIISQPSGLDRAFVG